MPDWSRSMQQTFEFYEVEPNSFGEKRQLSQILSCTITHDLESETISHAQIQTTEELPEMYVRVYLVTVQDGVKERFSLGTYLAQTPSISFNGLRKDLSAEAYSPLIELKEKYPPIGYAATKGTNVMALASQLTDENVRTPVVYGVNNTTLTANFISEPDESWLVYLSALIKSVNYKYALDERGRILFAPIQPVSSLQPIYTYNDNNSSILYPDISTERDLYGVPNVVEISYSKSFGKMYARVVNDDPESPISTVTRGREIVHRENDPDLPGLPTQEYLNAYARQLLKTLSSLEYKITYSHGYCPVRVDDCVLLNYERAGFENIKAKVIRQSIQCEAGCKVEETAVYSKSLWGD